MKIIKSSFLLCLIIAMTAGCNKITDLNEDTKNPTDIPGEYLFTNAQKNLSDHMASTNVNTNVFKLWAQYWAECQYPDESQYDIKNRNVARQVWTDFYRDVLSDLDRAKSLITSGTNLEGLPPAELAEETAVRDNKIAIADILMVFTFARLVDTFGDVPYSQVLDIDATTTPAYDDAETVYMKLFERLDANIAMLNPSFASYDPQEEKLYKGNVAQWITFANSLKFKMAITVADVASLNPGDKAQAALDAGIISTVADEAYYPYVAGVPNTNPLWSDLVASGRNDFVAANTLVDYMNTLEDPRRQYYFDSNLTDSINGEPVVIYVGGIYGSTNTYQNNTQVNLQFRDPTYPNAIMTVSEMLFYQAEAAASGMLGGDAESLYNEAITRSILDDWGGTQADVDAYLGNEKVAYATAPNGTAGATWQEKIAMQEWIAFYMRGFEGWTTWRRLDAPEMNRPETLLDGEAIPVRFNYPVEEQSLNGTNYSAAAAAIGGDLLTTHLFWDVD